MSACAAEISSSSATPFQEAGIPALLLDIRGANCYDLRQESLAYAGKFEANAQLDGAALSKVMQLVPARNIAAGPTRGENPG